MWRASEPKSAQTVTLTLGDGSHSSCFRAVSFKDKKNWMGYIIVDDTKAMEIHFFLTAGNIKPYSTDMKWRNVEMKRDYLWQEN